MITPVGAMLVIKAEEKTDKTTSSGLLISAAFNDDGLRRGQIVAIGTGEPNALNGEIIKIPDFAVGDRVILPEHTGHEIEDDGSKYLVVHYKHVIAKLG